MAQLKLEPISYTDPWTVKGPLAPRDRLAPPHAVRGHRRHRSWTVVWRLPALDQRIIVREKPAEESRENEDHARAKSGAKVTVVAVPNSLKNGVAASPAPTSTVLGTNLTILALRTPDGQPFSRGQSGSGIAVVPPKLGSVVVAIPADRLSDFATAALSSTFYLALSVSGGSGPTS